MTKSCIANHPAGLQRALLVIGLLTFPSTDTALSTQPAGVLIDATPATATDTVAQLLEGMSHTLGQPVIIDN